MISEIEFLRIAPNIWLGIFFSFAAALLLLARCLTGRKIENRKFWHKTSARVIDLATTTSEKPILRGGVAGSFKKIADELDAHTKIPVVTYMANGQEHNAYLPDNNSNLGIGEKVHILFNPDKVSEIHVEADGNSDLTFLLKVQLALLLLVSLAAVVAWFWPSLATGLSLESY